jgi:hypothetical protein
MTFLLGWVELAALVVCPAYVVVWVPLGLVWRPRAGLRRRLGALAVAAATIGLWYLWADRWHDGPRAVLAAYWTAYVGVLATSRDLIRAGDPGASAAGPLWWELTRSSWRVWAPLGLLLRALRVAFAPADGAGGPADPDRPAGPGGRLRPRRAGDAPGPSPRGAGAPQGTSPSPQGSGGSPAGEDGAAGGRPGPHPPRVERVAQGAEPPPRDWLVADVAPYGPRPRWRLRAGFPFLRREVRGYVTALLGSGGVGKSYLLLDLGEAATDPRGGATWLGLPVKRLRSVLYVDAELDAEECRRRAFPVARGRGLPGGAPPGPRRWWQLPWAWLRPWGLHYLSLPASVASPEGRAAVAGAVRRVRAEAVLFDSLTIGATGAALGDAGAWNRVLAGMEAWGVPVVLIDHLGKDAGRGAVGSFMKQARVRAALTLEREPRGAIRVEHTKANFGPLLAPFRAAATHDHGDPRRPVVSFATAEAGPARGAGPAAGPSRDVGEDAAEEARRDTSPHREAVQPGSLPPPVQPASERARPALRLVRPDEGPASAAGSAGTSGNRVHDRIDAEVLAAFRRYGGEVVAKEQIATETGYSVKTVDNACTRLRARGLLARPAQGRWRAVVGVAAGQRSREAGA